MNWFRLMIYTLAALLVVGVPWALIAAWRGAWRHYTRLIGGLGFFSLLCVYIPVVNPRGIREDYESLALLLLGAAGVLIVIAAAFAGAVLYWLGRRRRSGQQL
jgi:uncharacterized protein (TIGR03382 family)